MNKHEKERIMGVRIIREGNTLKIYMRPLKTTKLYFIFINDIQLDKDMHETGAIALGGAFLSSDIMRDYFSEEGGEKNEQSGI
jgi:CO/xanthine dehydrogenase FAD-binding subunit